MKHIFLLLVLIPLTFISNGQAHRGQENTQILKQSLDSINYHPWNSSTNNWDNSLHQREFVYDGKGQLKTDIRISWSQSENKLLPSQKTEYQYDYSGNNIVKTTFIWSTIDVWVESYKTESVYNNNDKVIQSIDYSRNQANSQWVKQWKKDVTYNNSSNISLESLSKWDNPNNQWANFEKMENSFNSSDKIELTTIYSWEYSSNQWLNLQKNEYIYNGNQFLLSMETFFWSNNSSWVSDIIDQYTYNSTNNIVTLTRMNTSNPFGSSKEEFIYDANDNNIQTNHFIWDTTNLVWLNHTQSFQYYDNQFTVSDLILPFMVQNTTTLNHKLDEIITFTWNSSTNIWQKTDKSNYVYSEVNINSIADLNSFKVIVFPNPTNQYISFKTTLVNSKFLFELFDLYGRKVKSTIVSDNEKVEIINLPNGFYIYTLDLNGESFKGQIIKY
tara:strand:- start:82 stop:1410 length:1329 start_codon:yes stop_codon:yes gene_type:complete